MNRIHDLYEVRAGLAGIASAVEQALSGGLSAIERDLLLEKLRAVYEAIRCLDIRPEPQPERGQTVREEPVPPATPDAQAPIARDIIESLYGDGDLCVHPETPASEPAGGQPSEKVLNETFEDDFSIDLASILASRANDSLRGGISMHDRLLLLNDLFEQDVERYEQTLDDLDTMENADDAYVYLYEHFTWDESRDGSKLLLSLIEKKFA